MVKGAEDGDVSKQAPVTMDGLEPALAVAEEPSSADAPSDKQPPPSRVVLNMEEEPVSPYSPEEVELDSKDHHAHDQTLAALSLFSWLVHHVPIPKFPPREWVPQYTKFKFGCDLNAGVLVAITVVPQGMPYAVLAGLPPIYGLYTATIPLICYALLGTSREIAMGPTAMMSLLVSATVGEKMGFDVEEDEAGYVRAAMSISLMSGIMQLLLYLFRANQIVNIISHSVLSGFTSGAGVTIFLSQLKYVLAIVPTGHKMHYAYEYAQYYIEHPTKNCDPKMGVCYSQPATIILGLCDCLFLWSLKKFKAKYPPTEDRKNKTLFKIMWKVCDFGALVMVAINILVAYMLIEKAGIDIKIVNKVPPGMMTPKVIELTGEDISNGIMNSIIIAILSFMESYAIGKKFADMNGYSMDIGQELFAIGVSNVVGSFFSAYPSAGSFSRTVVNGKAGSKSPFSNAVTASLLILTLVAITKALYYIPYCALASIILVSVINIIDIHEMRVAYRLNKQDFLVIFTSFIFTLFLGMEMGIMIGVLVSILLLVKETAVPHYAVLGKLPNTHVYRDISRYPDAEQQPEVAVFRFNSRLYFGNCNFFRDKVVEVLSGQQDCIVIDASPINSCDLSALQVLEELNERVTSMRKIWAFANVKGPVRDFFNKSGFTKRCGPDHFFLSLDDAVDAAIMLHRGSFRRESIKVLRPLAFMPE